jgi:hypothetical protein
MPKQCARSFHCMRRNTVHSSLWHSHNWHIRIRIIFINCNWVDTRWQWWDGYPHTALGRHSVLPSFVSPIKTSATRISSIKLFLVYEYAIRKTPLPNQGALGRFYRRSCKDQGGNLTIHSHLVPRLRTHGVLLQLPHTS